MHLWSLAALVGLAALAAAALGALGVAGAQEPAPEGVELRLSLVDENDGVVPPGSTISVAGELRMQPWDGELSVSAGSVWLYEPHIWEGPGRGRLRLDDQALFRGQQLSDDFTGEISGSALPAGSSLRVLAYDGDTIAARAFGRNPTRWSSTGQLADSQEHPIYVFKASTGEQVARLVDYRRVDVGGGGGRSCTFRQSGSTCSTGRNQRWSWGRANDDNTGSAVAVWQEDEDTAWMFVGWSRTDYETSGGNMRTDMGTLVIYEIDHSANTATRRHEILVPSMAELRSRGNPGADNSQIEHLAYYGAAVAVSADGSTLAVGARRIHDVGAVYVYTRPAGGWGTSFGGWNGGVRVSPVVIPPWGDTASERPFEPEGTTNCDTYCRSVSSFMGDVDHNSLGHALFGYYVALSADGSVLAVSAPEKRFSSTRTAGAGQFRGGNNRPRHGEVFVFTAPAGGWSATPNYKTETTPDRTEIAYNADASSFSQASHYNTGPDKRVQAPAWSFSFDWSNNQNYYLGERLALSPDGTTLAASDRRNNAVNIFQVSSPSGWASGPTTPSAQITGAEDGGRWGGFGFSRDGQTFALGDPTWTTNQGRVLFFERPADGSWADATDDDAEEVLAPTATYRRAQERWGRALAWNLNRNVLAVSATEGPQPSSATSTDNVGPGRIWTLTSPLTCPVTERTDEDGETTRTAVCAVELGDTRVLIPESTQDGTFTIAGTVTLTYGEGLTLERTARLEVQVGTVREVDDVTLDFAVDDRGTPNDLRDDRPHRSTLNARGDATLLRLQILNENEKAAAVGSVASVVATTTAGSLSTTLGDGCTGGGGGGNACELDVSALTVANTTNIPLTLTHGGTGGTAEVEVLVVAKKDGARHEAEPVRVTLAGVATSLSVEEAPGALLNVGTSNSWRTLDNRDVLELTVTARDALGNPVPVPTRGASWRITGPDGKSVPSGKIRVQWPLSSEHCATGGTYPPLPLLSLPVSLLSTTADTTASAFSAENSGNPLCVFQGLRLLAYDAQNDDFTIAAGAALFVVEGGLVREFEVGDLRAKARLRVNAASNEPLAAGEYTLELRAGALTATAGFRVSGGAAALALSEPDGRLATGERISVTATVSDEEGNAVSDGTPVEWSATDVGTRTVLVQISAESTTDGSATATWQVIGPGVSTVRAVADKAANVRLVEVPVPVVAPPPPPADPAEGLSSRIPDRLSAWSGQGATSASALLAALDGVSSLLLWTPAGWLRYALQGGQPVPGSFNFEVAPGSVLWLAQ